MLSHWKRGAAPDTRPSPLSPPPPIIQQYAGTYRTLRQARLRSRSHSSEPCADSSRNQYPPNKHILTVDGDEKKSYNSFQSYDGSVQGPRQSSNMEHEGNTHTSEKFLSTGPACAENHAGQISDLQSPDRNADRKGGIFMSGSRRSCLLAIFSSRATTILFSGNLLLALERMVALGVRGGLSNKPGQIIVSIT